MLGEADADPDQIRAQLEEETEKEARNDVAPSLAPDAKRALLGPYEEAQALGSSYIGPVSLVGAEGFDPEFGARRLRRTIQRKVDNELSRMLLEGSLNPGDRVVVGVEDGNLSFEVLEEPALVGTESGDEPGE